MAAPVSSGTTSAAEGVAALADVIGFTLRDPPTTWPDALDGKEFSVVSPKLHG